MKCLFPANFFFVTGKREMLAKGAIGRFTELITKACLIFLLLLLNPFIITDSYELKLEVLMVRLSTSPRPLFAVLLMRSK